MYVFAQTSGTAALIALAVICVGFVVGSLAAAVARRVASSRKNDLIKTSAGALATLAFSLILIIALITALGIINQTALDLSLIHI